VGPGTLDLTELEAGPDADEEPEAEDQPPEPGVLLVNQVCRSLDYEGPLCKRKAKAGKSSIPSSNGVAEAHEEEEANPVEEEGGDEGCEEDKVVAEQGQVLVHSLPVATGPLSPGRLSPGLCLRTAALPGLEVRPRVVQLLFLQLRLFIRGKAGCYRVLRRVLQGWRGARAPGPYGVGGAPV